MSYEATLRTKGGNVRARAFADTRIDAARIIFSKYPKADEVSTCRAYFDEYEKAMRGNGSDIQWIKRGLVNACNILGNA